MGPFDGDNMTVEGGKLTSIQVRKDYDRVEDIAPQHQNFDFGWRLCQTFEGIRSVRIQAMVFWANVNPLMSFCSNQILRFDDDFEEIDRLAPSCLDWTSEIGFALRLSTTEMTK